jgi:hypothetical protein
MPDARRERAPEIDQRRRQPGEHRQRHDDPEQFQAAV